MILDPAVIALLVSSSLICLLTLIAVWHGVRILRSWDLASGSGLQLELERRTYLISTVLAYVMAFQLASLFLFIFMADSLAGLFTGAMCAAGTLNVNGYGYPVLLLKVLNFLLAGLWLVLNRADSKAEDYPLVQPKYALLLFMAPLIVTEAVFQAVYFRGLIPEVITSCCGSLFGTSSRGFASSLASLPLQPAVAFFSAALVLATGAGLVTAVTGRGGWVTAAASAIAFLASIEALICFIGPYVYELPTHRCPFCVLQREYRYVGYLLYAGMLSGAVSGLGVGVLMPFRKVTSLATVVPAMQRRLAMTASLSFLFLGILTGILVVTSHLRW